MSVFSAGILRSNLHRVVYVSSLSYYGATRTHVTSCSTPPKDQANYERWSLVFFTRPGNNIELTALADQSPMIAKALKNAADPSKYQTGQTALSWFARRIKYQRIKNRTVRRCV